MIHLVTGYFAHHSGKTTFCKQLLSHFSDYIYFKPFSGANWRDIQHKFSSELQLERWVSRDLIEINSNIENQPEFFKHEKMKPILNPFHLIHNPINISSKWFQKRKNLQLNNLLTLTGTDDLGAIPLGVRMTKFKNGTEDLSTTFFCSKFLESNPNLFMGSSDMIPSLNDSEIYFKEPRFFLSYELMQLIMKNGGDILNKLKTKIGNKIIVESHDDTALPIEFSPDLVWVTALNSIQLFDGEKWKNLVQMMKSINTMHNFSVPEILPHIEPLWKGNYQNFLDALEIIQ